MSTITQLSTLNINVLTTEQYNSIADKDENELYFLTDNVSTADKLNVARTISLSGDTTGATTFDGSDNVTISTTLADSGVNAGGYGPSANVSPEHNGTFSVPYFTVDAKGRITSASTKTITLPTDTVYTHPTYTTHSNGLYKITVDSIGSVSNAIAVTKEDITALGIPSQDTVYTLPVATSSSLGGILSGTDITIDGYGNVSVNDNSHSHTISNISDLSVTATELNYVSGVTSSIQTQLDKNAGRIVTGEVQSGSTAKNGAEIFNLYEDDTENTLYKNIATGLYSHSEGATTRAGGDFSHAEGNGTQALGSASHAEGYYTVTGYPAAHAEGYGAKATNQCSHAEGYYTLSSSKNQHVQGKYNIEDTSEIYAHIVGNGSSDTTRSNAHTLDWSGNAWFAGKVTVGVGVTPTSSTDLTTKEYVDSALANTGGAVVSSIAPDVSKTTMLWVDLGNNAVLKYSDGTQWLPVGSVWG